MPKEPNIRIQLIAAIAFSKVWGRNVHCSRLPELPDGNLRPGSTDIKSSHESIHIDRQSRKFGTCSGSLVNTSRTLDRQITDAHQILIYRPRYLGLLFGCSRNQQIHFVDPVGDKA
jgi:hypothetical protein